MRAQLYIILPLLFFLNSCNLQKTTSQNKNIMIPTIDNKFEQFDIKLFKKENTLNKRVEKKDNSFIEENKQSYGYIRREYFNDSYFKLNKKFFESGNIQGKGVLFNNGSQLGVWYQFDEEGKLIEEINTDEGYGFSWKEVIKYCEDKKIELVKGFPKGGFNTSIYKEEEKGKKVWVITYLLPVGDKLMEITLDGKTGKELKRKKLDFIGG